MKLGINFLPTVGPAEAAADQFYDDCLELGAEADELGFHHVKMVEHHFHEWGGYSPDPVALLSAMARHTRRVRLVTGAVTPAFTHPIKLASSLLVLDNLSHGRLDAGFGRAFLPSEFAAFGVNMDDSRALLEENVEAIHRLWTDSGFRWEGRFHRFGPLPPLLPRPAQQPAPPVFIAATTSPETFVWAGRHGYHLMVMPVVASHEKLTGLLESYRRARTEHGHSRSHRLHVSYHAYVAESHAEAVERAEEHYEAYRDKQIEAYSSWRGSASAQYPGYERMEAAARNTTLSDLMAADNVVIGGVAEVGAALRRIHDLYPGAEISLHCRYGSITQPEALRTVRLLGEKVLPDLASIGPEEAGQD
ncbi:LLM class flavin-dependent oxidoreductase [Streptomyces pinistramenti]|uniref:LLM class flavin-dependent oxidoreductase n=1 Tax=Streptomyces pinistramenti TaxID=2884812 RepID=UPI001D082830|nr:LLM class flavin-dependent oxidoreductase [Streptomyces pinistramenti]MCB5910257.1 LLM class flavin-dependent oxidoreductase [Streptomyces pinistramenti]